MKFGGMSTPWGIYFYGDNYESSIINGKLKISKNNKPGKHFIYIALGMYLILDIVINFKDQISQIIKYIYSHIEKIPYYPQKELISIHFNFSFPHWVWDFLGWGFLFLEFIFIAWFMYKVRGYHGAEHKVILAAIKGDTSKAHKSPRITSHCGSNLLFPYILFFSVFSMFGVYIPGTSMILSFIIYQKIPYIRRHLSYIGSQVQRLTTTEPTSKELKEAQRGIDAIIKADEMRIYRQIKQFFIQMPMRQ